MAPMVVALPQRTHDNVVSPCILITRHNTNTNTNNISTRLLGIAWVDMLPTATTPTWTPRWNPLLLVVWDPAIQFPEKRARTCQCREESVKA